MGFGWARMGSANALGTMGLVGEEPWKVLGWPKRSVGVFHKTLETKVSNELFGQQIQVEQPGVPPEGLPKGDNLIISSSTSCLYWEGVVKTRIMGIFLILREGQEQ